MLYTFSQLTKRCMQTSYYKVNNLTINLRCLSQVSIKKQETPKQNVVGENKMGFVSKYSGYKTIYKFTRINHISMYNRVKVLILTSSCVIIPIIAILDALEIISHDAGMITSTIVCSTAVACFAVGILFENYIGFIYYKDENNIKIAYVDTWGKRVDIDTSTKDIKSLTSAPSSITDRFYRTIRLKSLPVRLKITINHLAIYNEELLTEVIGDH